MKTVIFILALTAIATPVFTVQGDAIACAAANPNNCNLCQKDAADTAATAFCYDCKPGYYLSVAGLGTSVCTRCPTGTGKAGGTAVTGGANTARSNTVEAASTCTACHATCAECWVPADANKCARCAAGHYASAFTAGVAGGAAAATSPAGTCTACAVAGKTRDVATTDISAVEVEATVCATACNGACAECRGTGATACTKCAAGHYATAFTSPLATCTACASGKGRAAPAAAPAAVEAATVCDVTCAAGIANCKGAAATDALWCLADYWYASNACTKCDSGKTKAAGTAMPTAAETAASCTGSGAAAGSSATLIQALCGASVAAYALF